MGRWSDAWRALVRPAAPAKPAKRRIGSIRTRRYEASRLGPADGWYAGNTDAHAEIVQSLDTLRATCRKLYRDNPYARRIVDALVNAMVSTGIRPTIRTGDERLDERVYDLWERWGKSPVAGSAMTIYGYQQQLARALVLDGEGLARVRARRAEDMPGLPPVKLQAIEADFLPTWKTEQASGRNRIYSGVEYGAIGDMVAYHLLREHPGSQGPWGATGATETDRIPADRVLHLYREERAGQVRGVPMLAPVVLAIWDLAGYTEAIRIGTRAAATLVATVKGGDESEPPDGVANEDTDGNAYTGGTLCDDGHGNPIEGLAPGAIIYAPDGKDIAIHTPQPPSGVAEFVSACLHEIAAGVNLSYHVLSGDMSDSSFAQAKLGLIEQANNIRILRETVFIPLGMDRIWRAFIDAAISVRLLPNNPRLYDVTWSEPRQQTADAEGEAKTNALRMQLGELTLTEVIESTGRDPDRVLAQRKKDRELCDKYGVVSSGDLSQVTTSGILQSGGGDGDGDEVAENTLA